jgi:hypothetical protein
LLYGLRIAADREVPGLPNSSIPWRQPDIYVHLRARPISPIFAAPIEVFFSSQADENGQPTLRVGIARGEYFVFQYADGTRFAVGRDGREIWADWPDAYSLEDAATYLIGPVMGFVLRLRRVVPLHASGVVVTGHAVALVGAPGAGKSTTAAAFAQRGFPVLSDDLVALNERENQFFVQPGYPRVNLWPDSVSALFGSEDALPPITPTWEKRYMTLDRDGCRFETNPLPLAAIYVLGERDAALRKPVIEEVHGVEAVTMLVANTYVNYLLDREMRRREFDVLGRLITALGVRRVRPPTDPSAIFGICEAIVDDVNRLIASVASTATLQGG